MCFHNFFILFIFNKNHWYSSH